MITSLQQFEQAASDRGAALLRNEGTLRHEEWKVYDDALIEVSRERLVGIADLVGRGLVRRLGSIGTTISAWERVSDMTGAHVSMDGHVVDDEDRVQFDEQSVPVPVIHKEFTLNHRQLAASRRLGESLDVTQYRLSAIQCMNEAEEMLFNGNTAVGNIYGYTTFPDRVTQTLSQNWSASTTTPQQILDAVLDMVNTMIANEYQYGPFVIYIPPQVATKMQQDFSTSKGSNTLRQRLLAVEQISDIKVSYSLASNEVIMLQLDSRNVDMAVAMDFRNMQWETKPMQTKFMVMGIMVPRLKSDYENRCGILHASA